MLNIWKFLSFDLYLENSWIEATAAPEWVAVSTYWRRKLQKKYLGRVQSFMKKNDLKRLSWVLGNENIWEIFAPWMRRLWAKLFWNLLKIWVWLAFVHNFFFHSHHVHVFCLQMPYFWQIFEGNISPWIFGQFFTYPKQIVMFSSKFSQIHAFSFCNFCQSLMLWIDQYCSECQGWAKIS